MEKIYNTEYLDKVIEVDNKALGLDEYEQFKKVFGSDRFAIGNHGTLLSTKGEEPYVLKVKKAPTAKYLVYRMDLEPNKFHSERIHRLVALHFVPRTREEATQVNHKDGDALNNHVNNLEWTTQAENLQHAKETGLYFRGMTVYEIRDEYGNQLELVIGLGGLRKIWGEHLKESTAYTRVSRKSTIDGVKAVAIGTVSEVFGEEYADRLFADIKRLK